MAIAQRTALTTGTSPLTRIELIGPAEHDDQSAYSNRVESNGWRRGRPIEDPDKTKRWGIITAKPSEYLIHVRSGRIRRKSTGQGASCFKWPWDSVSIIPTTINRLQFTADQVTLEKVGVQVTGLAVYRIVEPEIAYRMLNFSYAERASEKLAAILREMFEGATRRHIANLSVDDVMTRRKEAIAGALLDELVPVMRGQGQAHDSTEQGWGAVLDTVEIQNVRILSETVFRDMQAEYRSRLARTARQAELDSKRDIAAREAESKRTIEQARLSAEAATRELRAQAESRAGEIELSEASKREVLEAHAQSERIVRQQQHQIAKLRAQAEIERERSQQAEDVRLSELAREQARAESERQAREAVHQNQLREVEMKALLALRESEHESAVREAKSAAAAIIRRRELGLSKVAGELQNALAAMRKEIDNTVSEDRIRMTLVEDSLPAIAQAFAQQFEEVRFTQIGGNADPASMVAGSIAQVLDLARSLGLRLGGTKDSETVNPSAGQDATSRS